MSKLTAVAACALALFATLPALAQDAQPAASAAKVAIPGGVFYKGLGSDQYAAKDRLIGANVVNKDGVIIGDIKDLILNNANEVEGVILGTGGILGAGEKAVGVRYHALQFTRKDGAMVIELPEGTKDVIGALQPFNHDGKKTLSQKAWDKALALRDKTEAGAGPMLDRAKAAAGPMLERAKAAAASAVEKAKQLGGEAVDKTKGAVDSSTMDKAKAAAASAVEKAKELGQEAADKTKEAVEAAKEKAAPAAAPSAPATAAPDAPKQ